LLKLVSQFDSYLANQISKCGNAAKLTHHTCLRQYVMNSLVEWLTKIVQLLWINNQPYDDAANISGQYRRTQQKLREQNKNAVFIPCAAYSLCLLGRSALILILW
jgi:hypothetical protein